MKRKIFSILFALVLVLSFSLVTAVPAMAQGASVVLGGNIAPLCNANGTNSEQYQGNGSWFVQNEANKFELYIDPTQLPYDSLGSFTIDDIQSISYHTKKPGNEGDPDFYLLIYTEPDGSDDYGWYGYRLNAEPYFSEGLNAPVDQWNTWNTDDGPNQLTFFDSWKTGVYGFYGQPILQDLQAGTINWHDYNSAYTDQDIDYEAETVKFISFQTGSVWCGTFEGYIDAIEIVLTDDSSITIDLEGFADEVWVDDDWAGTAPGVEVEPDKFFGYNAFATIQDGVDAVAGSKVNVAAGTYNEAILIDKQLTLEGANAGIPGVGARGAESIIKPDDTTLTHDGNRRVAVKVQQVDGVTIDGFEIDGTAGTVHYGIYPLNSNNTAVKNNVIHDITNEIGAPGSDVAGVGIIVFGWEQGISGTVIEGNTVYNTGRMGIGITAMTVSPSFGWLVCSDTVIDDNTVHDAWQGPTSDHGGGIQINVAKNCSITNNEVYDIQNGQRGIYMFGSAADNTITFNTLRDNAIGIQLWISGEGGDPIDWEGDTAKSPDVHYNNIYDNSDSGAISTNIQGTPMVMDATCNWWGHASGPTHAGNPSGTGDAVSDYVDYDPWLSNPWFHIDEAKLDFKKKPDDDKVRIKGKLGLNLCGDGVSIDDLDDVIVTVGPLSELITMVEKGKKGERWEYKRPKGDTGDIKHVTIDWKKGKFDIRMDKANLTGVTNPVTISIQIGDDFGEATILMKVKKDHWDYKD